LDVDPLEFIKKTNDNFFGYLNGSLDENINYNIYNFENQGTIEIRISIEKPTYFSTKFKQLTTDTILVKFTSSAKTNCFNQIKGFKYILKRLNSNEDATNGKFYYTSS